MRMIKNKLGVDVPISNEELRIYNKLNNDLSSTDMNVRDIALADRLVKLGAINKKHGKSKTIYKRSR